MLNLAKCPHCDGHRVLRSVCYGEGHFVKGDCPHCHSCWPFKFADEAAVAAANMGCWQGIGEYDLDQPMSENFIGVHELVLVRGIDIPPTIRSFHPESEEWVDENGDSDDGDWITEFMMIPNKQGERNG